jgi:hypothetical protein
MLIDFCFLLLIFASYYLHVQTYVLICILQYFVTLFFYNETKFLWQIQAQFFL